LHYKYKTEDELDDISYKLCISNLFGKYDSNKQQRVYMMQAFRNESHHGLKIITVLITHISKTVVIMGYVLIVKKKLPI